MKERTLSEIVEAVKKNQEVEKEELIHALLAMTSLQNFSHREVRELLTSDKMSATTHPFVLTSKLELNHQMYHTALNTPPKQWLGEEVPSNPSYVAKQFQADKIIDIFFKDK